MTCSMPIGIGRGLVVRGGRADRGRIEHDDVRDRSVLEDAAVAQPEPRRRREVILRIASSSERSASSRTNWPRMRGKLP
jgi:hypothetical protein